MNPLMRNRALLVVIVTGAVVFGAVLNHWVLDGPRAAANASQNASQTSVKTASKMPLYWAAPMDPNYRRDQPGLSPMGMALVPVYEAAVRTSSGLGVVQISPEVINQLGVRTVAASERQLQTDLVTVGYVQYDETKLAHIHPRVSGWVEKLYVTAAGDPVEADMPLYALYAPELVNAQEELVIALKRANPPLIVAAEARLRALQVPEAVIQSLKNTLAVSQTVAFYAGQSGVVDNLNIREGFFVEPATTLMSIGQLESVWVLVEIPEQRAGMVNSGDAITMTLDYFPGDVWLGTVGYIYPTLDPKTRTLRARVVLENSDLKLRPNMFAKVLIQSRSQGARIVIPKDALIRTGRSDRAVLALGAGRFQSVTVAVGQVDDTGAEILSGLNVGDEVVTHAQFLIDSESNKGVDLARMVHGSQEIVPNHSVNHPAPQQDHAMPENTPGSSKAGHLDHPDSDRAAVLKAHPAKQNHAAHSGRSRMSFESAMPEMTTGLKAQPADHGEAISQGGGGQAMPARPQGNEAHHGSSQREQSHDHPGRGAVIAPSRNSNATQDKDAPVQESEDGKPDHVLPENVSVTGGPHQLGHQSALVSLDAQLAWVTARARLQRPRPRLLDTASLQMNERQSQRFKMPRIAQAWFPKAQPALADLPS